ncbi:SDR family oxidoreductase [Reichenbachiella agariperforans]|uniref:SDR family oxidoreductase n=1 Tax=Reichenbachiella agariperforans TaxID=156994 RepID=UPI001C086299|nr:SDR family oxidoreductase [Reichenbachiella agariperforans]MBU2913898.1 SDR family oxidoreductase [Reichenbachiella agariperforans]
MKSISILGCGWLGTPLAEHLSAKGYLIKGSTTTPEKLDKLKNLGIQPYLIDRSKAEVKIGDFFDTDLIIINIPPRNTPDDPQFHHKMIQSIVSQIDFTKTKIIFISSTAVYPNLSGEVTESDASHNATSRGGVALLEIEDLIANPATTILRFGGLYGPDRHPGRFLSSKTLGGKTNPINMIHLDDCIGVINSIMEQNIWGERFSVCSPSHPTKEQFYTKACQALGIPTPIFTEEETDYKLVNTDKLTNTIRYDFQH